MSIRHSASWGCEEIWDVKNSTNTFEYSEFTAGMGNIFLWKTTYWQCFPLVCIQRFKYGSVHYNASCWETIFTGSAKYNSSVQLIMLMLVCRGTFHILELKARLILTVMIFVLRYLSIPIIKYVNYSIIWANTFCLS